MQPDVSVIVPTYKEALNLPELVQRVDAAFRSAKLVGEILIIDDNSRDGTGEAIAALAASYPVRLIVRTTERGLSSAVIHGCNQATGRILLVMDADLSHPPETIPQLVRIISENQGDFALGSRYVSGGRTESWGPLRWLNSKVATVLAWPVVSCSDPMSGFFAISAERFRAADALKPYGYKIGLELMVKCHCTRVREVPILFVNRVRGTSKLTFKQQLLYLRHILALFVYKMSRPKTRGRQAPCPPTS